MNKTIVKKPWGQEEILEINDRYMVKKLTMKEGHRCSLQYHQKKRETIYILQGQLRILTGQTQQDLIARGYGPHESITIEPRVLHRMEAVKDSVYLESSSPEIDDVVRVQDDYQRK